MTLIEGVGADDNALLKLGQFERKVFLTLNQYYKIACASGKQSWRCFRAIFTITVLDDKLPTIF
jgi:hypothetical protein